MYLSFSPYFNLPHSKHKPPFSLSLRISHSLLVLPDITPAVTVAFMGDFLSLMWARKEKSRPSRAMAKIIRGRGNIEPKRLGWCGEENIRLGWRLEVQGKNWKRSVEAEEWNEDRRACGRIPDWICRRARARMWCWFMDAEISTCHVSQIWCSTCSYSSFQLKIFGCFFMQFRFHLYSSL